MRLAVSRRRAYTNISDAIALVKYGAKENGETYNKFFGGIGSFKRNWLKQARSKRI